eukprot:CAMPEP_0181104934 /NCGR_PEP_ID=MMETSP1071-20121207/15697_1 /TAXON_ID=35127 /ORGANISM="Thalassiosira sp., Strain NH16" /LENGTH=439 /DNA_ID=CAMNT_0023188175 /DNA_START=32 /DNA_END=1348 /DNA_ORIENTATION=-
MSLSLGDISVVGGNGPEDYSSASVVADAGNPGRGPGGARAPPSSGGLGGMRFLKSGLKKAQRSIERSVTTMAIRADGGKNPDQLCVSLHYLGGMNGGNGSPVNVGMTNALGDSVGGPDVIMAGGMVGDVCLSRTEWVELPSSSGSTAFDSEEEEEAGVLFSIPLCVPDLGFLEAAGSNGGGVQLTLRLYLRSGAALLKAVANREYIVGESALLYSNLMGLMGGSGQQQQQHQQRQQQNLQQQQQHGGVGSRCGAINVPFTTGMLAETSSFANSAFGSSNITVTSGNGGSPAALHITATPRIKFNAPCTYGWSLTDPVTVAPAGESSWLRMFNPPLDQGYVFRHSHIYNDQARPSSMRQQPGSSSDAHTLLLANERAVESALVLPLATAATRLFGIAARRSQALATDAAARLRRKEAFHVGEITDGDDRARTAVEAALAD